MISAEIRTIMIHSSRSLFWCCMSSKTYLRSRCSYSAAPMCMASAAARCAPEIFLYQVQLHSTVA